MVAAEFRFGAAKKNLPRLTTQLETIVGAIEVLALEAPGDAIYGAINRNRLEKAGQPKKTHDPTLGNTIVTDHERASSKVRGLRVENWRIGDARARRPHPDPVLGLLAGLCFLDVVAKSEGPLPFFPSSSPSFP